MRYRIEFRRHYRGFTDSLGQAETSVLSDRPAGGGPLSDFHIWRVDS